MTCGTAVLVTRGERKRLQGINRCAAVVTPRHFAGLLDDVSVIGLAIWNTDGFRRGLGARGPPNFDSTP